jgi:hypothetical protein
MSAQADTLMASRQELKGAIENLRPLLREIANAFVVRAEADLAALDEAVRDLPNPEGDAKAAQRQEKLLDKMQALVAGLKVQPEKGRFKDLRRLRDLLKELNGLVQQFGK